MRRVLSLLFALFGCLSLTTSLNAAPTLEQSPGGSGGDANPRELPTQDIPRFNPHTVDSVEELLAGMYEVDDWLEHPEHFFPRFASSSDEQLEVHLILLEDWLAGLDPAAIKTEARETHYSTEVTFTERIFLSWDVTSDTEYWNPTWDDLRDQSLEDLRQGHTERVGPRYRDYIEGTDIWAPKDFVSVFLRQIGAARVRSGGALWRDECLVLYRAAVADLLAEHPEFVGMSTVANRPESLETEYEDPSAYEDVWRVRAILDLLIASGPEGYQAILDYWATEGSRAFLPYPEKIALAGGGLGLPMFQSLLEDPALPGSQRQELLQEALKHTRIQINDGFWFAQQFIWGDINLYPYQPEQVDWLREQFRDSLLNATDPSTDPPHIYPYEGGWPSLEEFLENNANMLLEFPDPLAEVRTLLASDAPWAQAIGLATLVMDLQRIGIWHNEGPETDADIGPDARSHEFWNDTEATDLQLIQPYFESPDPRLQHLAFMVLLRLSRSPAPLEGERARITTSTIPLLLTLQEEDDPTYSAIPRVMALSMHRRGIGLEQIRVLAPSVDAYVSVIEPQHAAIEETLEILSLNRLLSDPIQNPPNRPTYVIPYFDPEEHQMWLTTTLSELLFYHHTIGLDGLLDEAEAIVDSGTPLRWELRRALRNIAENEEIPTLDPKVAVRITTLLDRR